MKAVALLALAAACVCLTRAEHKTTVVADKVYLQKQKKVYELFWHVDQPTVYHPELYQIVRTFSIEDHVDSFTDKNAVQEFLARWKQGMLPRGQVFSSMYYHHYDEMISLYKLLYCAKDFDTFYNTAVWARFHVNEQMYIYALTVAVLHRTDTKHIQIPPLYEVMPHFFYNDEVINRAYRVAMGDTMDVKKSVSGVDQVHVYANYSGWYIVQDGEETQQKLNYFTEDVGLNAFYFFANHEFPHWEPSANLKLPSSIRGDVYFFLHKQLLTRYYLERLSNDMGGFESVDWHKTFGTAYKPTMHYYNGLPFPQREVGVEVPRHLNEYVQELEDVHHRVVNAIDSGFIRDASGKYIDVYGPDGLNHLGNLVQGNADSPNRHYYGYLDHLFRRVCGASPQPATKYNIVPSALEIYSTSLRDPIFYEMYTNIVHYYIRYKSRLPCYTHEELVFPGVKIESVSVDKLMTYFDYFEALLSNAVSVKSHKEAQNLLIKTRQHRLNHKPFTYHITVQSDKNTKAVVRVFLGPKYDVHGHELDISENYVNFMQIEERTVELKAGLNKIELSSHESLFMVGDQSPSDVVYKKIVKALDGSESFTYPTQPYGFPDRLALPKGKKEGMPFKIFVYISQFDESKALKVDSPIWGSNIFNAQPMGFPLDRPVHAHNFTVPNMYFKDVLIYHKHADELNVAV